MEYYNLKIASRISDMPGKFNFLISFRRLAGLSLTGTDWTEEKNNYQDFGLFYISIMLEIVLVKLSWNVLNPCCLSLYPNVSVLKLNRLGLEVSSLPIQVCQLGQTLNLWWGCGVMSAAMIIMGGRLQWWTHGVLCLEPAYLGLLSWQEVYKKSSCKCWGWVKIILCGVLQVCCVSVDLIAQVLKI